MMSLRRVTYSYMVHALRHSLNLEQTVSTGGLHPSAGRNGVRILDCSITLFVLCWWTFSKKISLRISWKYVNAKHDAFGMGSSVFFVSCKRVDFEIRMRAFLRDPRVLPGCCCTSQMTTTRLLHICHWRYLRKWRNGSSLEFLYGTTMRLQDLTYVEYICHADARL